VNQDRAKRLLSKPIKFFNEMQELFSNSSADGSLAMDSFGCMNDKADSDESNDFNEMSSYAAPEDVLAEDSDTLPSPLQMPPEPSLSGDKASSSSGIKRRLGKAHVNSGMKPKKPKTRTWQAADDISSTLQALKEALTTTPPPPPPPTSDPHAALWERLEGITRTTDLKVTVGTFLDSKDQKGLRGFLCGSSEKTFQSWVYKFLSDM
jgi:hypothetical protein